MPMVKFSVLVSAPFILVLSACNPHQDASTATSSSTPTPRTQASGTSASSAPAPSGQSLSAQLHTADGKSVATATFEFANGYATVTVKTTGDHILTPGFHKMHIHAVGKCEPNSVDPMDPGKTGDFLSAGMHYQAPGHTGEPMSGDLDPLEVRQDGAAYLVTTTDAVTKDDLLAGAKTALLLHGADGGPDAEKRFACGVIGTG